MRPTVIRRFLSLESASGFILFLMAVLALLFDNSPFSSFYQALFQTPIEIQVGSMVLNQPLQFWINEGLMTLFFLLVGLELKREFIEGELAQLSRALLPGVAAIGGMLVPAVIYVAFNFFHPVTLKGWAVPVATDIAFALGVLSLFGKRVPIGLKLFLMALAIFDDVGAIIIIAIFYTQSLSIVCLLLALLLVGIMQILNYLKVYSVVPYLLLGMLLWVCMLKSGVHATVAGVLLAWFIPLSKAAGEKQSSLERLEHVLHPWVAYGVMPLFAFANAGISFAGLKPAILLDSVSLGIILGLFLGKQLGVFSFTWVMVKMRWAKLPLNTNWLALYGVSLICGIGFTMSLFLGSLAFEMSQPEYMIQVRLGVLLGSLLSAVLGVSVLRRAFL